MRARLGTDHLDMNSNISEAIINQLEQFQKKVPKNMDWTTTSFPNVDLQLPAHNCISAGLYAVQLKRWLYHGSMTNFRIYFSEDFVSHPDEVVLDVLHFIGVPPKELANFTTQASTAKINARPNQTTSLPPHQVVAPALCRQLEEIYAPYNRMLEELLGTKLPWKGNNN